jgi:hypothetical protein
MWLLGWDTEPNHIVRLIQGACAMSCCRIERDFMVCAELGVLFDVAFLRVQARGGGKSGFLLSTICALTSSGRRYVCEMVLMCTATLIHAFADA